MAMATIKVGVHLGAAGGEGSWDAEHDDSLASDIRGQLDLVLGAGTVQHNGGQLVTGLQCNRELVSDAAENQGCYAARYH